MANYLDTIMDSPWGQAFAAAGDFMAVDTCTIYHERTERNEFGKPSRVGYTVVKDYPCAISFGTSPAETASPLPDAAQTITLFIDSEVKIEPGAILTVTQGWTGRTENYSMAGVPKMYDTHQEIELERTDRKSGVTRYEDGYKPIGALPETD